MAQPTAADTAAARKAVERYCGWHVAPVAEDQTIILDGPGSPLLVLPTLNVVDITAVTEDGVSIDPGYLTWSKDGRVRKRTIAWWETTGQLHGYFWTNQFQGIAVTFTHGYSSDDVPDFEKAVTMVAESMAASGLRDDQSMVLKQVDDVRYQWSSDDVERIVGAHLLAPYRLEKTP